MHKWPIVKIGDILTERRETPPPQALLDGSIQVVAKIGFATGQIEFRSEAKTKTGMILAYPGDILISGINASKGAIAIYDWENTETIAATIHYGAYTPKLDRSDPRFLWWFFRSNHFQEILDRHVPGGIKTELKAKRFLPLPIPLPPLSEQRRIVTRIEELAAQINEAKELRREAAENTELLFNARASAFFSINNTKKSTLLETVSILERGKFNHRPRNEPRFFGGNHPWIQIGEIENSKKYIKIWSQTLNEEGLAISKKFPRGTVLISIAATIGAVGILDFDCCIPDSIVGVTPKQQISSEFLYYYLRYLRSHFEDIAPQCAQKNINLAILEKIPFPVYSLSEQNGVVAELNALQAEIDRLAHLHAETAAELNVLLPAVLDRAFKGEL